MTCLYVGTEVAYPSRWSLRVPASVVLQCRDMPMLCSRGDVATMQHPSLAVGAHSFRRDVVEVTGNPFDPAGRPWYIRIPGLDKTAWRILELLLNSPQPSRATIAAMLGVHPSTAGRVVAKLIKRGLVKEGDGSLEAVCDGSALEIVAEQLGIAGAAQAQRESYGWAPEKGPLPELQACPHRPPCSSGEGLCGTQTRTSGGVWES